MYLVGARFSRLARARAALEELRERIAVAPGDLGLRPLGSVRYEQPARGVVVAGRFVASDVDAVVAILERHGGEIVFRRADWRLPARRFPSRTGGGTARCQRTREPRT